MCATRSTTPSLASHTTVFEIEVLGKKFREEHQQRAYSIAEVAAVATTAGFEIAGQFEEFGMEEATEASERVHWVLRKPAV